MVDKSKKRKKGTITEDNISSLLERYSANTVIALLQEVSQVAGDKIDWREMAKNTATGICGAREYQMLWRHLAYGETLIDRIDRDLNPIDDDSDLEYELEAFPAVGREASVEAAACVKVLIASGHPNDSHLPNNTTFEAPLPINIPNSKALSAAPDSSLYGNATQGTNIIIPVSVQNVPSAEKKPTNEASGVIIPPRKRRRAWSAEEDLKLTTAVKKYGERNWASIARGDFDNDRKPSELSQRWSNLRKKQGDLKVGSTSQPSETQLAAAHRAMFRALDMPMSDGLKASSVGGIKSQHQPPKASALPGQQLGRVGPQNPQVPTKRPPMNPSTTPDSMVKAAAVAAGARIATSADASSLIEAARSQNVVHITTGGGGSVMRSTNPSITTNQLPSNVHFIRNGLAKAPISTLSSANKPNVSHPGEAQQAQGNSIKPAVQANLVGPIPVPKTAEDSAVSTSGNVIKEVVKSNQGADRADLCSSGPVERVPENRPAALGNILERVEKPQSSASGNALKANVQGDQVKDDQVALPCSEVEDNETTELAMECGIANTDNGIAIAGKTKIGDQGTSKEIHENQSPSVGRESSTSKIVD